MNKILFRLIGVIAVAIFSIPTGAQTFEAGGIYYVVDANSTNNVKVVAPQNGEYLEKSYTINEIVEYNNKTYFITEIGEDAFNYCRNLEHINLPNSLKKIGKNAFNSCYKLSSIQLPSSLEAIGYGAFGNSGITSIIIPASVNEIGENAFINCSSLTEISVNEGNVIYNSGNNCNAILKGEELVVGCTNTIIPNYITAIGKGAFEGSGAISIDIPNSVTIVKEDAFNYCRNLERVNLSTSLMEIGKNAFNSCYKLSSIQLPSSLEAIGYGAFGYCSILFDIESRIENPFEIGSNVFGSSYETAILSVPEGKVEIYKNTTGWNKFSNIQEIEPDPILIVDNKTYIIHKRAGQADLQSVVSGEYIVVPETIEYDGKNYTVTRILDSALEGSNMISLSIPSSVTYFGQNAIKDCYRLAAIDWNPKFMPSDEFVGNIVNPNLLFYVTEEQYKPDGVRNVIVGDKEAVITLTDEIHGNFYCPKAFTASNITYTHNYSLPTEKGLAQGWESIVLPFDVKTITTASGDVIKPVTIAEDGVKRFWLKELSETGLKETSQIKANVPYIISMPNWDGYQDFYNITGDVTFSAQKATIGVTENNTVTSGINNLTSAYQSVEKQNDLFALNLTETEYNGKTYAPGSAFIPGLRDIRPFEAYFTKSSAASARRAISIADLMEGTTAIADISVRGERIYSENGVVYVESAADGNCNIYSMSGQAMRKLALKKGTNTVSGLMKGVYIVNGQKVMVR